MLCVFVLVASTDILQTSASGSCKSKLDFECMLMLTETVATVFFSILF